MARKKKQIRENRERRVIAAFVDALSNKNYARANKYLSSVVTERIKQRIGCQLDKPLF
jgi:hypothetical protein